jgi:TRAP-type C4-dicarboxylate transport system substrate-binding protein
MMKKLRYIFLLVLLTLAVSQVSAQRVMLKIGSYAPENSVFGQALKEIAAEWREISGGQVQVRLYFAGFKDEMDLLRKIRFNQLQGGVVDAMGLQQIYENVMALSIPRLIRTGDELDYVLENIGPVLAEEMEKEGFVLLDWAKTGWVYFFTRNPAPYPRDLKRQDLASPGGEKAAITNALNSLGYNTVNIASSDVFSSLASGMTDAVYGNPIYVAANQWFGIADHMIDYPLAPYLGGIVISRRAWQRIPADLRPKLEAAVEKAADELDAKVLELEQEVIETMKERGLKITEVPPDARPEWDAEFAEGVEYVSGKEFSEEFVQRIKDLLREYRQSRNKE